MHSTLFTLGALLSACWLPLDLLAQEESKPKTTAARPADPTAPVAEHRQFAPYAGKWNLELTMGSPGSARKMILKGEAENEMILGGRFLQTRFRAEDAQTRSAGQYTLGFDSRHGEFSVVAMDTWGTYFVTAKGKPDPESKIIKLLGTDNDPQMAKMGLTKEFVFAYDLSAADTFTVKILFIDTRTPARREIEFMKLVFTRKT